MGKAMKAKSVKALPKGGIANALATATELKKAQCSKVLDALAELATVEVKKGKFTIPGLVMIKTRKKAARAASTRMMFGKMCKVKAQPAKTVVKAFCVKALRMKSEVLVHQGLIKCCTYRCEDRWGLLEVPALGVGISTPVERRSLGPLPIAVTDDGRNLSILYH